MTSVDGDPHDGLTVVHSEVLTSIEQQFRDAAQRCAEAAARARRAAGIANGESVEDAVHEAVADAEHAKHGLLEIAVALEAVHHLLDATEHAVQSILDRVSGQAAALLGYLGGPVVAVAGVAMVGPALLSAATFLLLPPDAQQKVLTAARRGLDELGRRVATPEGVALVAWLSDNLGSLSLGALRVPPHLAALFGEGYLDLVNLEHIAVIVTGLVANAGVSGVAGVRVTQQPMPSPGGAQSRQIPSAAPPQFTQPVLAPVTVDERVARVPDGAGSQVRVEAFPGPNGPRYEVYIAGTDPAAEFGGLNPWDMASNAALAGQLQASSLQATIVALDEAGATDRKSVV